MQQPMHDRAGYGAGPGYGQGQGFGSGYGPGGPADGTILAPGARTAGALICVVLLGIEIAWTVRDINAIGFHDTLWRWLALDWSTAGERRNGLTITSALDGGLIVLLLGGLVASRRSSAPGAYLAVGLAAVLFRLPGLWEFNADWTKGVRYHDRLLITSMVFVVLGVALVVAALACMRPAVPAPPGGPVATGSRPDTPAARPVVGAAVAAGILLLVVAVENVGWQIYYVHEYSRRFYPHGFYKHTITGDPLTVQALLTPAFGWTAWVLVALAVLAAVLAFRREAVVRPLGMAIALYLAISGVVEIDQWHGEHLLFKFGELPGSAKTEQCFLVFELAAAVLLAVLVAFRASPRPLPPPGPGGPLPGWGPPVGRPYGAPPPSPVTPPTAPPAPPGPQPGPYGGGYGYPAPGGPPQPGRTPGTFGPPPPYPPPGAPPTP